MPVIASLYVGCVGILVGIHLYEYISGYHYRSPLSQRIMCRRAQLKCWRRSTLKNIHMSKFCHDENHEVARRAHIHSLSFPSESTMERDSTGVHRADHPMLTYILIQIIDQLHSTQYPNAYSNACAGSDEHPTNGNTWPINHAYARTWSQWYEWPIQVASCCRNIVHFITWQKLLTNLSVTDEFIPTKHGAEFISVEGVVLNSRRPSRLGEASQTYE